MADNIIASLKHMEKNMAVPNLICRTGIAILLGSMVSAAAAAAPDPGKKACAQEARRLCPAEMKTLSRKKVEACMISKIEQTSPVCHAAMLRIKVQREAAAKR